MQADSDAANLESAADQQLASDIQAIQDTYNTNIANAQDQYVQAIAPFQQQLTDALASDQATCDNAVQVATDGYNSDMQTALDTQTASEAAADSTYASSSQPLLDAYNTWSAGRTSQYQSDYVTNDKPFYVQKEDAIAAAEAAFDDGVATATQLRDDHDADHYASRVADEAEMTSGYNDAIATHYEALQAALVPLQQTQTDAYDDALAQYESDAATAWKNAQGKVEDAAQQQSKSDAAAYENYGLQIAGPWETAQNQIAQAEQQRANDVAGVDSTYNTSWGAAVATDVSETEAAFDQAMSDLEAGTVSFNNILAPAWANAIIGASGNDPDTTTWSNAWASFDEQEAADDAQYTADTVSAQDLDVSDGISALNALIGQINTENQNFAAKWGTALLTLVAGDAGAAVSANGKYLPQLLSAADSEVDDSRAEATKEIDADATDDQKHAANDDQDAKDHDAHAATYALTVLPAGLADFTSVDDEAATDVGTLEQDAAGYVKQLDAAAVSEENDLSADGKSMIHDEAVATCDFNIATTTDEVNENNAAQTVNVAAVQAAPNGDFANETTGGDGYVTVDYTPTDPDTIMPDKDLPGMMGTIASFSSDVTEWVKWLTGPFLTPANEVPEKLLDALVGRGTSQALSMLSEYLPDTYMIGVQGDLGAAVEAQGTAELAVHFNGMNPLDWEFGLVTSHGAGVRMFGGIGGSFVVSTVQNCNSLNELKGVSGTADLGFAPAGLWSFNGAIGNLGTEGIGYAGPIGGVDNLLGRRPTVYSLSTGPTFSPPNLVEPVSGGYIISTTTVETITPREWFTAFSSWENIEYMGELYWQYYF